MTRRANNLLPHLTIAQLRRGLGGAALRMLLRSTRTEPLPRLIFRELAQLSIESESDPRPSSYEDLAFLSFCLVHRAVGNGQLLQDLWVMYETDMKQKGYFVEFGAHDGVLHSNTLMLEKRMHWRGLLAEPNQEYGWSLQANRSAAIDTRCVWHTSGTTVTLAVPGDTLHASVLESRVQDSSEPERTPTMRVEDIDTISLADLLDAHDVPSVIDYMSIDTEGSELSILSAFDVKHRDIRLLTIEHNHRDDERDLDRLMASSGYERRFPQFSDFDAWYRKLV
jgi:FkbM family methyltransferase